MCVEVNGVLGVEVCARVREGGGLSFVDILRNVALTLISLRSHAGEDAASTAPPKYLDLPDSPASTISGDVPRECSR